MNTTEPAQRHLWRETEPTQAEACATRGRMMHHRTVLFAALIAYSAAGMTLLGTGADRFSVPLAQPPARTDSGHLLLTPPSGAESVPVLQSEPVAAAPATGTTTTTSASAWNPIGPTPIPTTPTTSGRVTAIAVHPTNPNIVYAGAAQGGVYRTTDGGSTWVPLLDSASSLAIGAIAIAPSNPSTVFVGTGEGDNSADSYAGVGVYVITSADSSTPSLSGPINKDQSGSDVMTRASITRILVSPNDPNTIFVSTTQGVRGSGGIASFTPWGVYRSSNALSSSASLTRLDVPPSSSSAFVSDMIFDPSNANNLVVAASSFSSGGLFRSTNALGSAPTFTQVLSISGGVNVRLAANHVGGVVEMLAATGENPGTTGQNSGKLLKSTDGGATWPTTLAGANGFCGTQCFYDIAVALDPGNSSLIYLGGQLIDFEKSADGGMSFVQENAFHPDTHVITIAPSNSTVIYTGNDGGIFKSTDSGGTFASLNNSQFSATQFESIALHPVDGTFTIGGTQDNGTLLLNAIGSWSGADFGDGGYALIDQNAFDTSNVTMYHTYSNQTGSFIGFARVTNTANAVPGSWTFLGCDNGSSNNGIGCSDNTLFYAPMALGPGNPNTLYFGTDRLYRSTNQGTTMTVVSQVFSGAVINTIAISPRDDNARLLALNNGKLFATSNGSNTLTDVTGPITNSFLARVAIDPNNSNIAYAAANSGAHLVWKNTNLSGGGSSWSPADSGLPLRPVNAFAIDPSNSNHVFAGTDNGVFHSFDAGSTWAQLGTGLPAVAVFDMAVHKVTHQLWIATHGRGMYEILPPQSAPTPTPTATPTPAPPWVVFTKPIGTTCYVNNQATTCPFVFPTSEPTVISGPITACVAAGPMSQIESVTLQLSNPTVGQISCTAEPTGGPGCPELRDFQCTFSQYTTGNNLLKATVVSIGGQATASQPFMGY